MNEKIRSYLKCEGLDDLLPIDDALLLAGTESVQGDWIILIKQKRGNKKPPLLIVKGGSFG